MFARHFQYSVTLCHQVACDFSNITFGGVLKLSNRVKGQLYILLCLYLIVFPDECSGSGPLSQKHFNTHTQQTGGASNWTPDLTISRCSDRPQQPQLCCWLFKKNNKNWDIMSYFVKVCSFLCFKPVKWVVFVSTPTVYTVLFIFSLPTSFPLCLTNLPPALNGIPSHLFSSSPSHPCTLTDGTQVQENFPRCYGRCFSLSVFVYKLWMWAHDLGPLFTSAEWHQQLLLLGLPAS